MLCSYICTLCSHAVTHYLSAAAVRHNMTQCNWQLTIIYYAHMKTNAVIRASWAMHSLYLAVLMCVHTYTVQLLRKFKSWLDVAHCNCLTFYNIYTCNRNSHGTPPFHSCSHTKDCNVQLRLYILDTWYCHTLSMLKSHTLARGPQSMHLPRNSACCTTRHALHTQEFSHLPVRKLQQ